MADGWHGEPAPARVIAFLKGLVGVGKTRLGQTVSDRIGARIINANDLRYRTRGWVTDTRRLIERVVPICRGTTRSVVTAQPLRARDFALCRTRLNDREMSWTGLMATLASISARARTLSPYDTTRAARMTAEGDGTRAFIDAVLHTDAQDFAASVDLPVVTITAFRDPHRTTLPISP